MADENNEDVDWVHVPNGEVTGTATITVSAEANTQNAIRCAILKIKSDELEEKIYIVQYDEFSEIFVQSNIDNSISLKSSSDYNHPLASWSMALSYAAYNPIAYQALPFIPSGFMQDPYDNETKTAKAELENMGFDATSYNYDGGYLGYAAHTIGHRKITITNNDNLTGDYNYDINGANTFVDDTDNLSFRDISVLKADSGSSFGNFVEPVGMDSGIVETVSESDSNSRTLIVISVRGSVTPLDWAMDVLTQVHIDLLDFEAGRDMVLKSLYGYKDECEECSGLTTSRRENDYFFPNPPSRLRRATSFAKGG